MAISREDLELCLRRVVNISIRFVWSRMKTHPCVSCTLIFLAILYVYNPSLFWLLIHSSTFICVVVSTAKIYRFDNANNPRIDEKNISINAGPARTSRLVKNDFHARSVRRRRSRETSRDYHVQTKEEEKSTVFSSNCDNATVDKSALVEEQPKEIREVEIIRDLSAGFRGKSREGSESSEEEDDERDKEANNKAVQWNEDDQKNLMDLGISEIERNRRLESLIARRRARKLLSLQVRKTLMNMEDNNVEPFDQITPLMVPARNNPSSSLKPPTGRFSPMPGSAPSVLIPVHNPFDIPYDPQEEKPILTGGSFDQEFLPLQQKDVISRYHETSSLGSSSGELKQEQKDTSPVHDSALEEKVLEAHDNSGLQSHSDQEDTEKIIEVEASQSPKPKSNSEEQIQGPQQKGLDQTNHFQEEENREERTITMLSDNSSGKSSSASSSEEEVLFPRVDRDAILKSLSSPVSRNLSMKRDSRSEMEEDSSNSSGPSMSYDNKLEGQFFFSDKAFSHTSTYSISSDMQVEVSEISSPPLTGDGSISSYDGNRISEASMEGEIVSSSEDISAPSSNIFGGGDDEKESTLRDIHKVNEIDRIDASDNRSSKEPIELAGKIIEEVPNPLTLLTSNAELPDESQMPNTSDSKIIVSEKQEMDRQQSYSSENTEREVKSTCNHDDSTLHQSSDSENFSIRDRDSGPDSWIQEGGRRHTEWSLTSSPTYIGYPGDQAETIEEQEEIFAYYEAVGEKDNLRTSGDSEGESIDIPQHENLDMAMEVEQHDTQESNRDNEGRQQTAEPGFSRANERHNNRQVSRLLPHLVVQQLHAASVIPSSPRSVLQQKFAIDHCPLSHYDEMHEEFGTPMAEISLLNEARGENLALTSTTPRPTTLVVEHRTSHISHGRDAALQEISDLSISAAEEEEYAPVNECTFKKYESGQTDVKNFPTSSNLSTPATEAECDASGSEYANKKYESEQTDLKNFPASSNLSTSTVKAECNPSVNEYANREYESGQSDFKNFPTRSTEQANYSESGNFNESCGKSTNSPESTSSELEPMDKFSSSMLIQKDEVSEEVVHVDHEPPNAFAKSPAESSEVANNSRKNEMLVREMEEKSKDFLKNLMDALRD